MVLIPYRLYWLILSLQARAAGGQLPGDDHHRHAHGLAGYMSANNQRYTLGSFHLVAARKELQAWTNCGVVADVVYLEGGVLDAVLIGEEHF